MDEAINELEILSQNENIIGLYDAELLEQAIREEIREKGQKEEKIVIAKKMLNENMDIEVISKITDLSIEQIQELK